MAVRIGLFPCSTASGWPPTSPGAEADISDRDGHLTMIGRIGEIHDWLLQYF
jgi:hypothetical protein